MFQVICFPHTLLLKCKFWLLIKETNKLAHLYLCKTNFKDLSSHIRIWTYLWGVPKMYRPKYCLWTPIRCFVSCEQQIKRSSPFCVQFSRLLVPVLAADAGLIKGLKESPWLVTPGLLSTIACVPGDTTVQVCKCIFPLQKRRPFSIQRLTMNSSLLIVIFFCVGAQSRSFRVLNTTHMWCSLCFLRNRLVKIMCVCPEEYINAQRLIF